MYSKAKQLTDNRKKNKPKKRSRARKQRAGDILDNDYKKFNAELGCVITGQHANLGTYPNNIHNHHIKRRKATVNDYLTVALMGYVHMDYHSLPREKFTQKYNLEGMDIEYYFLQKAKERLCLYEELGNTLKCDIEGIFR